MTESTTDTPAEARNDQSDAEVDQTEELQLDETEERRFRHGATGYGVELHGGTAAARIAALNGYFDDPLVTVDCREVDTSDDVIDTALRKLGVDEDRIDRLAMGAYDLRTAINETEHHFAILELDALDFAEQKSIAQTIKAVAEGLNHDDIMLGFTASAGGTVTSAEPDLSLRVRSWQVGPESDEYGPLGDVSVGDEIETSARETPMEVVSVGETPAGNREVTAKNHHGEYKLRSYRDGTVTLDTGRKLVPDVGVDHVE